MDVSRSTFSDIQGFRRIIEVGIGDHLVLQCGTDAKSRSSKTINARIEESRSTEEAAHHDFDFHAALIRLAGNRTLCARSTTSCPRSSCRIMTIGKEIAPV